MQSPRLCLLVAFFGLICEKTMAQAVQLPTYSFFTASTSVSVPDSGGAYQGGMSRARHGRNAAGLPGTPAAKALVDGLQAGHSAVTATVIDHREHESATSGRTSLKVAGSRSNEKTSAPAKSSAEYVPGSIAEAERLRAADAIAAQEETRRLLRLASEAEGTGKVGVARIYYSTAAKRADGVLLNEAVSGLRRLQSMPTGKKHN